MNTKFNYPRVAIVITHWNDEETTTKCLEYLKHTSYPNYEIVLVDSGSSDGSADRINAKYPYVQIIRLDHNRGHATAANAGASVVLEKENVKYIVFLDNDAFIDSDCISRLIETMEIDPQVGVTCPLIFSGRKPNSIWYAGGYISIFGNGKHIKKHKKWKRKIKPQEIEFATSCVMAVKSETLRKVGLFDETYSGYSEDLDLSVRVRKAGYKLYFLPSAKAIHGESSNIIKVAGKEFRDYYTMRNRLFFISKHGTFFQRTFGLMVTIIGYCFIYGAFHLLRGESNRTRALYKGVKDFFNGEMGWKTW